MININQKNKTISGNCKVGDIKKYGLIQASIKDKEVA
jgi:hypothetical protein